MNYNLIKDILTLIESFEKINKNQSYQNSIDGFCQWIIDDMGPSDSSNLDWANKKNGRSVESVISTMLVHMGKYAKSYSKSAIHDSAFSTQDEFIYLITLKTFGVMTKTEFIRHNNLEIPTCMHIIIHLFNIVWVYVKEPNKKQQ